MLNGFALLGILCVIAFIEIFAATLFHAIANGDDILALSAEVMTHIAVLFIIVVKVII